MRRDEHFQVIYTSIEDDPDFLDLTAEAKLTFYTLKCSPFNNAINLFPAYYEALSRHASLSRQEIERGARELWRAGFLACQYPMIWIVNGLKFNPYCDPGNANHLVNIYKLLANMPRQTIVGEFCRYYGIEPPLELLFTPRDGLSLPVPEEILEAGIRSGLSWTIEGPIEGPPEGPPEGPISSPALLKINIKDKGLKIKDESAQPPETYIEIILDLNEKLAARAKEDGRERLPRGYQSSSKATRSLIDILIEEHHYKLDDFIRVHDIKIGEWYGTEYEKHLNPGTLYNPEKFEKYLNQKPKGGADDGLAEAERLRSTIKAGAQKTPR